jgi:hypothetical protein
VLARLPCLMMMMMITGLNVCILTLLLSGNYSRIINEVYPLADVIQCMVRYHSKQGNSNGGIAVSTNPSTYQSQVDDLSHEEGDSTEVASEQGSPSATNASKVVTRRVYQCRKCCQPT